MAGPECKLLVSSVKRSELSMTAFAVFGVVENDIQFRWFVSSEQMNLALMLISKTSLMSWDQVHLARFLKSR